MANRVVQRSKTNSECHYVIANMQGNKKTKECPFYHNIDGARTHGKVVQFNCSAKYFFVLPVFENGIASTNQMALICYGEHPHPVPPARKIPTKVKDDLTEVLHKFGLKEATARRLLASPMLPLLLDGKPTLSAHHVALTNMDAVNHLIRREKSRQHPLGTDILGVQQLMTKRPADPYIRQATQLDDGHFVVLCQFEQQSEYFFVVSELQADKTFRRNRCREFEVNSFDNSTNCLITLSRVWTDYEDEAGYYQAFRLIFDMAEQDVGRQIRWGHLIDSDSDLDPYIKAIIVDEHGGQMKGLGKYFHEKHPDFTSDEHITKIVKVCQTHYKRSITKMEQKGLSKGISDTLFSKLTL
jgi:hypothetical protein